MEASASDGEAFRFRRGMIGKCLFEFFKVRLRRSLPLESMQGPSRNVSGWCGPCTLQSIKKTKIKRHTTTLTHTHYDAHIFAISFCFTVA